MNFDLIKKISLVKTIYLNFKVLPFRQAIQFPIVLGRDVQLRHIGNWVIKGKVTMGMITFGIKHTVVDRTSNSSVIDNYGKIVINGTCTFRSGLSLRIDKNGTLSLGNNIEIGANAIIIATKSIAIGNEVSISWNCSILDSDMHYIENTQTGEIKDKSNPVIIGNSVWIGNNCSIGKGVHIYDYCIVASSSVLKKSFKENNVILAGIPAKIIASDYRRIFDLQEEYKLNRQYGHE